MMPQHVDSSPNVPFTRLGQPIKFTETNSPLSGLLGCGMAASLAAEANLLGSVEMKARMRHVQPRESVYPGNEQVRVEIQNFLLAIASYPDRFAQDPDISFEQHFGSLAAAGKTDPRRQN